MRSWRAEARPEQSLVDLDGPPTLPLGRARRARRARTSLRWPDGPAGARRPAARLRGRAGGRPGDRAARSANSSSVSPGAGLASHQPSISVTSAQCERTSAPGSPRARHRRNRQPPRRTTATVPTQPIEHQQEKEQHRPRHAVAVARRLAGSPSGHRGGRAGAAPTSQARGLSARPWEWARRGRSGWRRPCCRPRRSAHTPTRRDRRSSWWARRAASRIQVRNRPQARCGRRH